MDEKFLFNRVRGTHDWLDLTLFNFFLETVHNHLQLYGFQEISIPILEHTQLFKRSLGLETDVVSKEMFTIARHDEAGQEEICLRPEATASVMRAFLEHGNLTTPWKIYLHGAMFRYERPQKGRLREFHQVNLEVIGSQSPLTDVQMITMLDRLFSEKLSLDTYALRLNFLGCWQDRQNFKKILHTFLEKHQDILCQDCKIRKEKNILRVFDCKQEPCIALYNNAPQMVNYLCSACAQEWQQIQHDLELLSVSFSYDPKLVRGLDYYNKIVFEFTSADLGAQSAFCGGGRYDGLARQLGANHDIPAIGAAMGIERILLLLEQYQQRLTLPTQPPLYLILPFETAQQKTALLLADQLQAHNVCVDVLLEERSLKDMLRTANKRGARAALILGPDEQQDCMVTVKNMITGEQEKIPQVSLVDYLRQQQ
jgi:histidyl-tRNA synthetase